MAKKSHASLYTPAELITGAAHFGDRPEVMAGALYGVKDPITREEAQKRLEEFKSREVAN